MDLREEAIKGQEAKQLLENPIFQEAIKAVESGIVNSIRTSALGDESTHHRLAIALQLHAQIVRHIEQVVQTGHMAEMQLKQSIGQRLKKVAGL